MTRRTHPGRLLAGGHAGLYLVGVVGDIGKVGQYSPNSVLCCGGGDGCSHTHSFLFLTGHSTIGHIGTISQE